MHLQLFRTIHSSFRFHSVSHQFSRQYYFLGKMNLGRKSVPTGTSAVHREFGGYSKSWAASDPVYDEEWPSLADGISIGSKGKRRTKLDSRPQLDERPDEGAEVTGSLQFENSCIANSTNQPDESSLPTTFGKKSISVGSKGKRRTKIDLRTQLDEMSDEGEGVTDSLQLETSRIANSTNQPDESSLPTTFGKKSVPYPKRRPKLHQAYPAYAVGIRDPDPAEGLSVIEPFDICLSKSGKSVIVKASLHAKSREKHIEMENSMEEAGPLLRSGMVILKNYITLGEQVKLVKKCRELGVGPGGFYQPGYQDGAKLRLQMMCLGRNWDPETRKYENQHPIDGSEPPGIPHEFSSLVKKAIQDSHALIKEHSRATNAENILPGMSPDICIVNFYTTTGRLGLHKDRDESNDSLHRGLPVVSFSVGDSAVFLYGDERDVDKAEEVLLESGDVLIFGGKSRHIYHGVRAIVPNSAPPALLEESKLRPGRLNLTFRQF